MTTAKSGFYGTDGASADSKYRKRLVPNSDEAYFLQVNKVTGDIEVWNEEFGADKYVGVYKTDDDGNVTFEENQNWWGGAKPYEKKYFQSPEGTKSVKEFAEEVIVLDKTTGRNNEGDTNEPINEKVATKQARELINDGKENTPDDADPDDVVVDDTEALQELKDFGKDTKTRSGTREKAGSFGKLSYPKGRLASQDFIKFTLLKYEAKDVGSGTGGTGFGFGDRERVGPKGESSSRTILGSVSLPIPGGIKDENGCVWGPDKMDEMKIQTSDLARAMTGASGKDAGDVAGEIAGRVSGNSADVKKALQETLAGNAVGARNILSRMSGMVLNPNLELLFQEPTLRPFSFTFDLTPRSKSEAQEIVRIIRFFKQGMSPIRSESNLFLKSPHTFQVHFIKGGTNQEHPFIGKMKECAMTNFAVDYTPQQNYSTLAGGEMTAYKISMSLKELEPVFNDDYKDDEDSGFSSFREDPAENAALQNTLPAKIGF